MRFGHQPARVLILASADEEAAWLAERVRAAGHLPLLGVAEEGERRARVVLIDLHLPDAADLVANVRLARPQASVILVPA